MGNSLTRLSFCSDRAHKTESHGDAQDRVSDLQRLPPHEREDTGPNGPHSEKGGGYDHVSGSDDSEAGKGACGLGDG